MECRAWSVARKAFAIESDALSKASEYICPAAFERAVAELARAPRIAATGCGHSGIACRHFAHLMCCIELPARFLSPSDALHGGLGFLKKGDVLLLASRGGRTAELLPVLDLCRRRGITTISVTENLESPLARGSDIVLQMHVERETDKYDSQGTTSFIVLSAIFDALQAALIEATGFRNEQFAEIHPGGAVGERLNRGRRARCRNTAAAVGKRRKGDR